MLRKLLSAAFVALALIAPATFAPRVQADTPGHQVFHAHYQVMYRPDHHHPWRIYGTYHSRHQADHAADHLRHHGYEVHIDVVG